MVDRSTVIALTLLYRSTATVALTAGRDSNEQRVAGSACRLGERVLGVLVVVLRASMAAAALTPTPTPTVVARS